MWESAVTYSVYRIVLAMVAAAAVACFFTIIGATADQIEASARARADASLGTQCNSFRIVDTAQQ